MTSVIAHGDLAFHNPLSPARVDGVLDLCGLGPATSVLDLGCGPGELLIRAAERSGCRGVGYDAEPAAIEAARGRARERVPTAGLRFEVRDTLAEPPSGAFDLVACLGSMHAVDGGLGTLRALAQHWVLVADGFWRRTPPAAYLSALGATEDELGSLADLAADASYVSVVSDGEWDAYEWTLIHNLLREGSPDAVARAESARARVLGEGGRDVLGFALVLYAV